MAQVDHRETLITYLRAETMADAAKTLGISGATLAGRIKLMRKAGVNVPVKKRTTGISKLEVAALNSLVKKYLKELEA